MFDQKPAEHLRKVVPQLISQYYRNAQIIKPHTGQKLTFCDTVFEVMYTQENYAPNTMPWVNDSSLVLRMNAKGVKVLFMGDCEAGSSGVISKMYENELKSVKDCHCSKQSLSDHASLDTTDCIGKLLKFAHTLEKCKNAPNEHQATNDEDKHLNNRNDTRALDIKILEHLEFFFEEVICIALFYILECRKDECKKTYYGAKDS
jgi:hypothetical protein